MPWSISMMYTTLIKVLKKYYYYYYYSWCYIEFLRRAGALDRQINSTRASHSIPVNSTTVQPRTSYNCTALHYRRQLLGCYYYYVRRESDFIYFLKKNKIISVVDMFNKNIVIIMHGMRNVISLPSASYYYNIITAARGIFTRKHFRN